MISSKFFGFSCVASGVLAALTALPAAAHPTAAHPAAAIPTGAVSSNAVFGCDAPGAAWRSGSGGTYNNALIVTHEAPPSAGVYGPQQGDLAVFTEAGGFSGAFRCAQAATILNTFAQAPNLYSGYVFNLDESPTPSICYAPAGVPCEDANAVTVMFLQNRRTAPREAFQRFTTNLNLIRTAPGSLPVLD